MEIHHTKRKCVEIQLSVPWGHIAAKAWGLDQGQRVLLVHGTVDNAGTFDRLIQHLPENYYYVAIDLPGHGFSSHFPAGLPLKFFDYVYAINFVLEELKWKVCVYIGHSLGAILGISYNIVFPEKFEKIICLDLHGGISVTAEGFCSRLKDIYEFAKLRTNDKSPHLYTQEQVLYALQYKRLSCLTLDAAKALSRRGVTQVGNKYKYTRDLRLIKRLIPLLDPILYIEMLCTLSCPTLIISSTYSVYPHDSNDLLTVYKLLQGKKDTEIVYVNGNHDVHNNYPERVVPFICNYLRNIPVSKL